VLADLAARVADLGVFYTDHGVLPRAALQPEGGALPPLSLHLLHGSRAFAAALFALAALAALALALGVRARLAALVSWLLAVSLHHRNPAVLSGGDLLLALLLLWSALALLDGDGDGDGDGYGYGRGARPAPARGAAARPLLSAGTVGLLFQVASVYLTAGLIKLIESPAWRDGVALALAGQDVSASPWIAALGAHPILGRALTWGVLGLEILGPLLLFSPVRTGPVRAAVVLALLALQTGIALGLQVGIFPYVSAVALVVFVPPWLWDRLRVPLPRWAARPRPRPVDVEAEPPLRGRERRERFTAALIALCAWTNLGSVIPAAGPPRPIAAALEWLGLAQDWSMYVDLREPSGWFHVKGVRPDGEEVPLLTGGAPLWIPERGHPASAPLPADARRYRDLRWHAYLGALARRGDLRLLLAEHLCRVDAAARPAVPMQRVEIRFACVFFCDGSADLPPPPALELVPCGDPAVTDARAAPP